MSFPPGSGGIRIAPVLSSVLLRPRGNLFGGSRSGFRPLAKSDRLEIRIGDRHHFGLLTGMTSDPRPPCPGIRRRWKPRCLPAGARPSIYMTYAGRPSWKLGCALWVHDWHD